MALHEARLQTQEMKEDQERPFNPEHAAHYAAYADDFLSFIIKSDNPAIEDFEKDFASGALKDEERKYLEAALNNYKILLKQTQEVEMALTKTLIESNRNVGPETKRNIHQRTAKQFAYHPCLITFCNSSIIRI